jgi:hypothetical protein
MGKRNLTFGGSEKKKRQEVDESTTPSFQSSWYQIPAKRRCRNQQADGVDQR